ADDPATAGRRDPRQRPFDRQWLRGEPDPVVAARGGRLHGAIVGRYPATRPIDSFGTDGARRIRPRCSVHSPPMSAGSPEDDGELVARVVAQAGPSVLGITVAASNGSGSKRASAVCIGRGQALTTADAVDGAGAITISTVDGRTQRATVVGVDPATDIALLGFEGLTVTRIQVGSAGSLQVGRQVISVGVGRIDQHWVST